MDPSLQDTTCVCPHPDCIEGMVPDDDRTIAHYSQECPRCDGFGYILCDDIREGERTFTMAQQRAGIVVIVEGDDDRARE